MPGAGAQRRKSSWDDPSSSFRISSMPVCEFVAEDLRHEQLVSCWLSAFPSLPFEEIDKAKHDAFVLFFARASAHVAGSSAAMLPARKHARPNARDDNQRHRQACHGWPSPAPAPDALDPPDRPGEDRLSTRESSQVLGHRCGRGVAAGGLFLQAVQADRLQVARNRRVNPPGRLRLPQSASASGPSASCPPGRGARRSASGRGQPRDCRDRYGRRPDVASPRACSGDMYAGVPSGSPSIVSVVSPASRLARPKSVRCGSPCPSSRMFAGLTSRWITPWPCA